MESKEHQELKESMGHLIDSINDIDGIIDNLDELEVEEYREIKRKIDGLYAETEEIKKSL